jgi:hypothetical protein
MAMGYEGLVRVGTQYVLGMGASVPRTRDRIESASGYGGKIYTPRAAMGIGAPFNYDWEVYDGSITFEMTRSVFDSEIYPWVLNRQSVKEFEFNTRLDNVQKLENCLFSSISISTSEAAAVSGDIGVTGLQREIYTWGDLYKDNRLGVSNGKVCPPMDFPPGLNPTTAGYNRTPIPFWNTEVLVTETTSEKQKNFIEWSVTFNQSINKFFGCNHTGGADPGSQPPLYMACGPMTVSFTGTYMDDFTGKDNGFLGDHLAQVVIKLGGAEIKMKRLESTIESDDIQAPEAMVPLGVDYAVYELDASA